MSLSQLEGLGCAIVAATWSVVSCSLLHEVRCLAQLSQELPGQRHLRKPSLDEGGSTGQDTCVVAREQDCSTLLAVPSRTVQALQDGVGLPPQSAQYQHVHHSGVIVESW